MPAGLGFGGFNGTDDSESLGTYVYFGAGDGTDSIQFLRQSIDAKGGDDVLTALDFPLVIGGYTVDISASGYTINGVLAYANDVASVFYGGAGNDTLNGGNRRDVLYGQDDNDTLYGNDGNDHLAPGAGDDTVYGGNGADTFLTYLEGADSLYGGLGNDVFWFDEVNGPGAAMTGGTAIMDGGDGIDTLRVSANIVPGLHLAQVALTSVEVLQIDGLSSVYGSVGEFGYFGLITGSLSTFNIWLEGAGGTLDLSTRVEALRSVFVHGEGATSGLTLTGTSNRDRIIGSAYDDVLKGNGSADRLEGGAGNDTIHSGGQNDDLVGGAGIDTVSYATATGGVTVSLASYNDQYTGGAGIDLLDSFENLTGSSYADTLTGSAGDNVLSGRAGNDTLNAGAGNDTLDGGAGADTMAGGSGIDVYFVDNAGDQVIEAAGGGSDTVFATANFALGAGQEIETLRVSGAAGLALTGNELANYLMGGAGNDTLNGGAGFDRLEGGAGADMLAGGTSFDFASYENSTMGLTVSLALPASNTGEATGDSFISIEGLIGSKYADHLIGNSEVNTLQGMGGADILDGGAGFDYAGYMNAGSGVKASLLNPSENSGDAKGDSYFNIEGLIGSKYNDTLIGDAGNNWLDGREGADYLNGGAGIDAASYFDATVGVYASLANSSLNTGFAAGDSYVLIEGLAGSRHADQLIGDSNNNILTGQGGADVLDGGNGFDYAAYYSATEGVTASLASPAANTGEAAGDSFASIEGLIGSENNDVLIGNSSANRFYGLGGADTFVFNTALGAGNVDVISDFVAGSDRVGLDLTIFSAAGSSGTLGSNAFFAGSAAHDADDRIVYNSTNGQVLYDADGSGAQAGVVFATLATGLAVTANDFFLL